MLPFPSYCLISEIHPNVTFDYALDTCVQAGDTLVLKTICTGFNAHLEISVDGLVEWKNLTGIIDNHVETRSVLFNSTHMHVLEATLTSKLGRNKTSANIPVNPKFSQLSFTVDPGFGEVNDNFTFILDNTGEFAVVNARYELQWKSNGNIRKEFMLVNISQNSQYNISRGFNETGVYDVNVTVSGLTCSWSSDSLSVIIGGAMLTLTSDKLFIKVITENVTFNLSGMAGAQVDFMVDFGDGTNTSFVERNLQDREKVFQVSKSYSEPGVYVVTAHARTTAGYINDTLNDTIVVQWPIPGLDAVRMSIKLPQPVALVIYEISLNQSASAPTNVTCLYDYGEGTSTIVDFVELTYENTIASNFTFLANQGKFLSNITCWNNVSIANLIIDVTIVPLTLDLFNVTTWHIVPFDVTGKNATVPFNFTILDAFVPPTGVDLYWVFESESKIEIKQEVNVTLTSFQWYHNFTTYGNKSVELTMRFGSQTRLLTFAVRAGALECVVNGGKVIETYLPATSKDMWTWHSLKTEEDWAIIELNGILNYTTYDVDYGDGTRDVSVHIHGSSAETLTLRHLYNVSGVYNLTVLASNVTTMETKMLSIFVEYPLRDIELKPNWTQSGLETFIPMPPGAVTYTFMIPTTRHPPTNATCDFSLGDGYTLNVTNITTTHQNPYTLMHTYQGHLWPPHPFPLPHMFNNEGAYPFWMYCKNRVSEVNISLTNTVVEGISKLKIVPKDPFSNVNYVSEFRVSFETGQNVTLTIYFGDSRAPVSSEPMDRGEQKVFRHVYIEKGTYAIFLAASNQYQTVHSELKYTVIEKTEFTIDDFNLTMTTHNPIDMNPNTLMANAIIEISVFLAVAPPLGVNVNLQFGDGENYISPFVNFTKHHSYATPGTYNLSLHVTSEKGIVGEFQEQLRVIRPCFEPEVHFPMYQNISSRLQVMISSPFTITSIVSTDCPDLRPIFHWAIMEMTAAPSLPGGWKYDGFNVTNITQSSLYFSHYAIPAGIYEASLRVSMEDRLDRQNTSRMFFEVVQAPLVVAIDGGQTRMLINSTALVLDAQKLTRDPNQRPGLQKAGLRFSWSCGRLTSSLDRPILKHHNVSKPEHFDNVTCFGSQGNPLNATGVNRIGTNLLVVDTWYIYRVIAEKDALWGVYDQLIMLRDGGLDIKIK